MRESDPTALPRFTHHAVATRRLDACVAFYARYVNLRRVRTRGKAPERVVWLAPAAADAPIFVFVEEPGDPSTPVVREPWLRHLGFEFDTREQIDAVHARMTADGLDASEPRWVDEVVGYVTLVHDPDGRVVEFSQGQDVSPDSWDHPAAR